MTMISRLIAAALLATSLCVACFSPALAQVKDTSERVATPTSFLESCADKIEARGRLRFCDAYFREKLGTQADALLYLRDRITGLRASHEESASEKYNSFLSAIYIVSFLTIVSIVLVASDRKIKGTAKWASLATSIALLLMVGVISLGWLGKYRAEYAAQIELGILRDRIEAEAAQVIATGQDVTPELVVGWTNELSGIGRRFAENYANASPLPEIDRFHDK
ncbi:phenylalanyl-tRNA synthetase subunit alpha [Roseibium algae]|uniref:Phenylalanyl-tRNA synthetase subunit alpha n=1 Tax=Roseibium algae TaxID=3123038 RepID=A0ABU8TQQ0_9HYPH